MKTIRTEEAVGLPLSHDITRIDYGKTKEVCFKKGHIVVQEDIPILLSLGKKHLFVSLDPAEIHEEEATTFLYNLLTDDSCQPSEVHEGKIVAKASTRGLLKVNREKLIALNEIEGLALSTKVTNIEVQKDEKVAAFRVIPLTISKSQLEKARQLSTSEPLISVKPFKKIRVGIVTTGSEVYTGLVEDAFYPVLKAKFSAYPLVTIVKQEIVDDQPQKITVAIKKMLAQGVDLIVCTGGMSVDPDDLTPLAIKQTGAEIVTHGTPVLPGSMFLLAYKGEQTIIGLPGGVLFSEKTVFDLLLPRLMAKEVIKKSEIIDLSYGGYL
ncbi:molybdopterin-binding protein [Enterococcus faecalis]|uniref:molybdopterin-binding protein n=1 Tax=Enterococcus TaxID=1350 RepID=UPI000660B5E8|nr:MULTISPECIES: molybdopterin-binding protein [Enterococcus]EGO2825469.1 molybdopterin-binding protein [Enterococcus faecalis]EGO7551410.1 molybdopterin-binding protein [Enterococcus faecalis]EGO9396823.1 molybdenum cofactor biosynthesis protein MoaB [Enterococcus faecalis]EGS7941354.1 molybdopterin-binding protein [Enterococcus faecalis]EHB6470109.1 molybdopterin-binding protein [Enterococcus faecalis]